MYMRNSWRSSLARRLGCLDPRGHCRPEFRFSAPGSSPPKSLLHLHLFPATVESRCKNIVGPVDSVLIPRLFFTARGRA
jgi:hypothetical protein